jgi:Arc/MetJ-type ribon-helix-helix transcriptional regulator
MKNLCKKVSVSLPESVHEWLKNEAEKQTEKRGSRVTVSSIIQELLKEWRADQDKAPPANAPASNARPSSPTFLRGKTRKQ